MNLKQRFLTQNILTLVITIVITGCFGLAYSYLYNILNESHVTGGVGKTVIIVMGEDGIVYNSEDLTIFEIKEILMNLSVENNRYEYENEIYSIKASSFSLQDGSNYRIITLNQVISIGEYYTSFIAFVFIVFFTILIIANIVIQKQNLKNIIMPITNLTKEAEKLRIGELETAITDNGYGEVRELGIAIEQLRLKLKNSIYYQQKVDENRKFLISSISHDINHRIYRRSFGRRSRYR
jgi:methyl-accepting chemotaxis protein